jgi:hypothetical protein
MIIDNRKIKGVFHISALRIAEAKEVIGKHYTVPTNKTTG